MPSLRRKHGKDQAGAGTPAGGPAVQQGGGRDYWRSLEELAQTPEFLKRMEREFPEGTAELLNPGTRRDFLRVMGASLALAGLTATGCRWPKEKLAPYAYCPQDVRQGEPKRYATAMELSGVAAGLLVTSFDGRPIKIEGNPSHPGNMGAASAIQQASVLDLYDPDRSMYPVERRGGQKLNKTWDDFAAFASQHFAKLKATGGRGLVILREASSSLGMKLMMSELARAYPAASIHEYEPISWENERQGLIEAYGSSLRAVNDLSRAEVVVALDSDLLGAHPDALRHTRDFASGRGGEGGKMNRLFVAESSLSLTGAAADHRLPLAGGEIPALLLELAAQLSHLGIMPPDPTGELAALLVKHEGATAGGEWVRQAAADLAAHRGTGLITVGPRQVSYIHGLAHLLNTALGNAGGTVRLVSDGAEGYGGVIALKLLQAALDSGQTEMLLILGGNPVYDGYVDLAFRDQLKKVPVSIHLSTHDNETSEACTWHLNRAHYLESWGDARAWDGTLSIVQPLIEPLYGGKTPLELLALIIGRPVQDGYSIVREALQPVLTGGDFESLWREALSSGVVPATGFPEISPAQLTMLTNFGKSLGWARVDSPRSMQLTLIPDSKLYDGRFAGNAWLQEMPDPLTKVAWDNALMMSVEDAAQLGLGMGDMAYVDTGEEEGLVLPVYIMPGQAKGTVTAALGYGRARAGKTGSKVGANTYLLRGSSFGDMRTAVKVEPTGLKYKLATTQDHYLIDTVGFEERGRRVGALIREAPLKRYLAEPEFAKGEEHPEKLKPLWTEHKYTGRRWGMAIDLSACTGCSACMVACQAENNIPAIGRRHVLEGRAMHWIRVDRYFKGGPESPGVVFQPLTCQQCEMAPCESVCPVTATVHTQEGLNDMVYNRCVGTRYCSNNCPYKVRRFNFFNYRRHMPETHKMVMNPEVTVRSRGVMEKCSFCVQRIEAVKIRAKNDNRAILDQEIVPACAQTCPARAITFGDLSDPASAVSKLHADPRAYMILAELDVKPRNAYLAKLRNPAPGLEAAGDAAGGSEAAHE